MANSESTREPSATNRLLPDRDATMHFPVRAWREVCSVCVHCVYDDVVGLSSPLLAEIQFVDCVISALFSAGREI